MPLTYTTGTINQPNAGSVGQAMAEKIRDDIVAHAAWDLIEEFTPASGQVRWYVFKCLSAQSGLPSDFYLVMGRTLSSGELRWTICEGYDSGSHTLSFYPATSSGTLYLYDASGRRTETFVLGTVALTGMNYWRWTPAGTSTKWWIVVGDDCFSAAFNGPANGFVSCGVYTHLTTFALDMPIQMHGSDGAISGATGGITRNPSLAGSNSPGYGLAFDRTATYLGFRGDLRYNDRLQGGQRPVAEIGMTMTNVGSGDWPTQYGYALGKLNRIRIGTNYAAGFAFGDAYALGGTLWVPYRPDDSLLWDTGVASS